MRNNLKHKITIELSIEEKEFIITLLRNTSVQRILDRMQSTSTVHPDHEDFIEFELTMGELEELIGELSYEANHNQKKRIAMQACDIADGLENLLYYAKCS